MTENIPVEVKILFSEDVSYLIVKISREKRVDEPNKMH